MLLLDSFSTDSTEEIEAAWVAEAVRRADELERGEVEALDGESVLKDLKVKFQSRRPVRAYKIRREAADEIVEAASCYEQEAAPAPPGLGADLIAEYEARLETALELPGAGAIVANDRLK